MSWSICIIGKPENIKAELQKQSEKLEGQSKEEFDAAMPHMSALVDQNVGNPNQLLKLTASGHAYFNEGKKENGSCLVNIEGFWGTIV